MRSTGQSLFPGPAEHSRRPGSDGGNFRPRRCPRRFTVLAESPVMERAEIVGVPALCRDRDGALPCPPSRSSRILGSAGDPVLRGRQAAALTGSFIGGYEAPAACFRWHGRASLRARSSASTSAGQGASAGTVDVPPGSAGANSPAPGGNGQAGRQASPVPAAARHSGSGSCYLQDAVDDFTAVRREEK